MDSSELAQGFGNFFDNGNAVPVSGETSALSDSAFMGMGISPPAPSSVSSSLPTNNGDPMLSAPIVSTQPSSGDENQPVNVIVSLVIDPNPMAVTLVTISGVPLDAVLSAGINNGNGSWTLTPAQLTGLTLTPADGFSGGLGLVVTAQTTLNGITRFGSASVAIIIDSLASSPNLSVQPASGDEGEAIPLVINTSLVDNDGSEILSIVISDVPVGATLSAGINNGDDSWTLTPAQLVGLTITPPAGSDDDFTLNVTAISEENGTTADISDIIMVTVNGVANEPILVVGGAITADEDTVIALSISAQLSDLDGSETLSVVISNVPDGATLSAGVFNGNSVWVLNPAELIGLTLTPPQNYAGDFTLQISAISTEQNGESAFVNDTIDISLTPVADMPLLQLVPGLGDEDTPIFLDIQAMLTDLDGSEILSVMVSDVPMGAVLSAGINNGDGSWTLSQVDLEGLYILPTYNNADDFVLNITARATESNGDVATQSGALGPPPIRESMQRVSLGMIWTIYRRFLNGTKTFYGGADHWVSAAG